MQLQQKTKLHKTIVNTPSHNTQLQWSFDVKTALPRLRRFISPVTRVVASVHDARLRWAINSLVILVRFHPFP
jgi:hypothetical protein